MRPPERIPKILKLIETHWKAHPDYRFGQLLINLGVAPDSTYFWNIDDADLEKHLKKLKK